jgi:P22 coat protein - gene protein 5
MPNAWQNPSSIAAEALVHLEDSLVITRLCTTDKTADFLTKPNGYAVSDTVKIKTRPEYTVEEFSTAIVEQDVRESVRQMTIEKLFDVSVTITSKEKALNLDDFSSQVIQPAMYALSEKIDRYVGTKILLAAGLFVSDDLFATQADMALARQAATIQQLGQNRICLLDSDMEAALLGKDYFSTWEKRGEQGAAAFNAGAMGRAMNMDFYSSMQFPADIKATAGTMVCLTNNGAGGNTNNRIGMTTLTVDTQTASRALVAGDRLAIVGVRRPLIVQTAIADTSATTTVALVDPITEQIPDNAGVSVIGTTRTNMAAKGVIMDKECLAFAMPLLDAPSDKPSSIMSSNGFSIRVVQGYNQTAKKETMSLDCLVGAQAYDPRRMTLLRQY